MADRSSTAFQPASLDSNRSTWIMDPISPSSTREMDIALDTLQGSKDRWINLDLGRKINILDQLMVDFNAVAEEWVAVSMQAKGIPKNSFGEGEEWFNIAISNRLIRLYKGALLDIQKHGKPIIPGPMTTNPNGQLSVQVFPQTNIDRLLLRGTTCQIIMEPGITPKKLVQDQASIYQQVDPAGKITLILGAGNTSFLIPGDILAKLINEGHVILFKPNQ